MAIADGAEVAGDIRLFLWVENRAGDQLIAPSSGHAEDGHLHFVLDGERMKGEWLLIRMKSKKGEKRENWLLRKLDDEYAQEGDALVEQALTSVDTGRSMAEIAAGREPDKATGEDEAVQPLAKMKHARRGKKAGKPPKFAKP